MNKLVRISPILHTSEGTRDQYSKFFRRDLKSPQPQTADRGEETLDDAFSSSQEQPKRRFPSMRNQWNCRTD